MPLKPTTILTEDQIRLFHANGFLQLPVLSPPSEVAKLRDVFDRLFAQKAGRKEGFQYDLVGHDEDGKTQSLPQIINPVNYAPELKDTLFRANALAIARQLYGPECAPSFEHAILKPAEYGAPTPWHQDEAHRVDPNFEYRQLSIWMPLQEATEANGCMKFIPGSNLGPVLAHASPGNDTKVHALECIGDFDKESAVIVPLPAGGATVHAGRTIHGAGPNRTNIPRRAYILGFEVPPKLCEQKREFPWLEEKQTANSERRKNWRRKGGFLVEAMRKLRRGFLTNPKRLLFEVKRVVRAIFR